VADKVLQQMEGLEAKLSELRREVDQLAAQHSATASSQVSNNSSGETNNNNINNHICWEQLGHAYINSLTICHGLAVGKASNAE